MSDDDELRTGRHLSHHIGKTADVGVVEGSIDLVEHTERTWLVEEQREDQADGGKRLFTARQGAQVVDPFTGWLGKNLDPAFEQVFLVAQGQRCGPAAEQLGEGLLEYRVDRFEGLLETGA